MLARTKGLIAIAALALILVSGFSWRGLRVTRQPIPSASVIRGAFVQSVVESGEIEATSSMTISSPRVGDWGTRPQITWLADEGTQVKEGDVIARFDPSGIEKVIFQKRAEQQIKHATLTRTEASQRATTAELQAALLNTEASFELAKLALEQLRFEAEVRRREGELRFTQAQNDLQRAKTKIESQAIIHEEEFKQLRLELDQARAELEKAEEDMASLEVRAPAEGLVVFERNWNTGNKFQVGDTPWPGQAIIGLPDLSEMRVKIEINEIDVSKLELGQPAEIRLDAFAGPVFGGRVTDIATLGRSKEDGSDVKVFEVNVLIDTTAAILKPGMTASCEIRVSEVDDTLSIPIDAVFTQGEQTIVHRAEGSGWEQVPVELGIRSDERVVLAAGLEEGDEVALIDPNNTAALTGAQLEELASQPKSSKGSSRSMRRVIVN